MSISKEIYTWSRHVNYCDDGPYSHPNGKRRDLRLNNFDAYRLVRELMDDTHNSSDKGKMLCALLARDPWRILTGARIFGHKIIRI